jgi:hypothetical protein
MRGQRGTTKYSSFPGFSTTMRREGAPMVPPIPTPRSWLVPAAWITRQRVHGIPYSGKLDKEGDIK